MRLRPASPRRVLALALAVAALWQVALAQDAIAPTCTALPGTSELSIAELGRVVFRELATDRAADAASFAGGVCLELEGERVVIEAERFEVTSYAAEPSLRASAALVTSGAWRLQAATLELDSTRLLLVDAGLEGDGVIALAERFEIALPNGVVRGTGLVAATPSLRLDLAVASFDGEALSGTSAVLSSCDCPPGEAAVRIESEGLWLSLDGGGLELEQGTLVVGVLRLPLPRTWALDERDLERLRLPLTLERDERRGWLLALPERSRDGVRLAADVALEGDAAPPWRVAVRAEDDGAFASLRIDRDGALARVAGTVPLTPWLTLGAEQRLLLGRSERYSDAALVLQTQARPAFDAGVGLQHLVRGELGAALSAQRRGGSDLALPRAWTEVRWRTTTPTGPAGALRLDLGVGASGYLGSEARQSWWSVAPRWTLSRDAWSLAVAHEQRGVVGASPFGDAIDRVVPRSLTSLTVVVRAEAARLDAELRVDWRDDTTRAGIVGLERARVALLTPAIALGDDADVRVRGTLELAGRLDPRARRDAFVRVGAVAAWPQRQLELGVDATVGLLPGDGELRSLVLSVAAPVPGTPATLSVRPYAALDLVPTIRAGAWPDLRGHGLELRWETSYGTVDLAYRSEPDGSLSTAFGLRLPTRAPTLDDLRP